MNSRNILTGITTTGTPHLGNYVGAIRPAINSSNEAKYNSFFFLAEYHSLIKTKDGVELARVIYSPHKPLSCGARVWVELDTDNTDVDLIVREGEKQ